ncbi:hypothetical protein F2P56_011676 [Juglans regia]|uniref:DUF629 domain-containing protein n=1 Tax=Juglans regia TaxID=51240 RepID=A0A833XTM1_JUGRE|nr:hypothetical protein F2P56_011676 [Juglans regia]
MRPTQMMDCHDLPVVTMHSAEELDRRLRDVEDSISQNPGCVLSHTTRSRIQSELASRFDDQHCSYHPKLQHLDRASNSASIAVLLAPMSPCLALLYATALFQIAEHIATALEYKAVIKECLRGLMISIPREPVEDFEALEIDIARLQLASLVEASADRILSLGDGNWPGKKSELEVLERKKKEIFEGFSVKRQPRGALKNVLPDVEMRARVRTYWENTTSHEKRMEFFNIGIQELEAHLDKNNLNTAKQVLKEAIELAKETKKWKFWLCCCCGARSWDDKSNLEHIANAHCGGLSEYERGLLPQGLPREFVQMVESGDWGPVNFRSANKIMRDLSSTSYVIGKEVFCRDKKRIEILDRIRSCLQLFIGIDCFAPYHLQMLQTFTAKMLQKRFRTSIPTEHVVHQTLQSILLLEASELQEVFRWLTNLGSACALRCLSENSWKKVGVQERTDFCSSLLLERFLGGDIDAERTSSVEEVDADAFVRWLCKEGPAIEDHLKAWTNLKETAKSSGMEFFKILGTELQRLRRLCREKSDMLLKDEAIVNVQIICGEEVEKGERNPGYVSQCLDSLLFCRKTELLGQEGDSESDRTRAEICTIVSILEEADTDATITMAIKKHRINLALELSKQDALILATNTAIRNTEQKLGMVSAFDYGSILVILLKSFLQV